MSNKFDIKINGMTDGNQVIKQIKSDRENNIWVSVKDKGLLGDDSANDATALNILITAIGSTPTDLYFPRGIYRLGTNVTIPNNINIIMACGAILQPQSGVTITGTNTLIEAGLYQWIDCSLSATPLAGTWNVKEVYPEWFNNDLQATLDSFSDCTIVLSSNKTYTTNDNLTTQDNTNILMLNNSVLNIPQITLTNNSGITGIGKATIQGKLKLGIVNTQVEIGSYSIVLESGHQFSVGDKVKSSYGLRTDSQTGATITEINGNTIIFDQATHAIIPVGAYIGNFDWTNTVILGGNKSYIKNVDIVNNKGYAFLAGNTTTRYTGIIVDDVRIYNNGLDSAEIRNCEIDINKLDLGYIYDVAKQGLAIRKSDVNITNSNFHRGNYDPDFFLYDTFDCNITVSDSKFSGLKSNHPGIYDTNSFALLKFHTADSNVELDSIKFNNCEIEDYDQGVLLTLSDVAINITLNKILFSNCTIKRTPLGRLKNIIPNTIEFNNCVFDEENTFTSSTWFLNNPPETVNFKQCTFENFGAAFVAANCFINDCTCKNAEIMPKDTCVIDGLTLIESRLRVYPYDGTGEQPTIKNLKISHTDLVNMGSTDTVIYLSRAGSIIPFSLYDGTLSGYAYNNGGHTYYKLNIPISISEVPKNLKGDDWYIPVNSLVENLINATSIFDRFMLVTKSNKTTIATTVSSGVTSIDVVDATGFAVDDYINILMDNGYVHASKITNVSGTTITFGVATTHSITSGNPVCDYLYQYTTRGTFTWNPGSLADGAGETSPDITFIGATLGDFVIVSAPYTLDGVICTAYVSATNTIKVRLQNESGGVVDFASGTWHVRLIKY
jgi:hypothetical protein